MTKYKNISADDKMVLVAAGRKLTNGEPFSQYRIIRPGQTMDITGDAIRGAVKAPFLKMIIEDDAPEEKKVITPATEGVETKINNSVEVLRRRGRPPKIN
jgi:hypothetical protein